MTKYNAHDFFMIRTPLFSVEDYINMFEGSSQLTAHLSNIFKSPILSEALVAATPDLLEALDRSNIESNSNAKSSKQILSSLIKYFIRLSTRPTPFGLFSGIAIGRFGNESNITIDDTSQHTKRARPDMEWVYGLIKKIEANKEIRSNLGVRFNDFTYTSGNRIDKPNKTFLQLERSNENTNELSTSIRYTNQVKMLVEKCTNFQTFSGILEGIAAENPNVPASRIEGFLSQLLENEYLLSELRPPLTNTAMLDYLLNILSKLDNIEEVSIYTAKLAEIQQLITTYNSTPIGKGTDIYNQIIRLQKELYECKSYLQVDMKTHVENNLLCNSLKHDLEQFASAMYKLAPVNKISNEMAAYIALFAERYGYTAEVPVMELLDTDKGLGSPAHYNFNVISRPIPQRQKTIKENRLKTLLERKMIQTLREGKKAIELTDQDIDYVCESEQQDESFQPMDNLQSFELYLLAHPEAQHKFTLAPAVASDSFGRSFGRFSDMLTHEESLLLKEGFDKNKTLMDEYIIAEISEVPSSGRTSNVTLNNSDYDYQVALTTNPCENKHIISIRDLYIGLDTESNNFYIKSKSHNKKVIVTMTSMMNPTFGSSALRFLREVSAMRKRSVIDGILGIINLSFDYCPRITYGTIIIKPETWMLSKDMLSIQNEKDNKLIEKNFELFRQKWELPRFVFLNEADNRLLLDLDNPNHKNEIYNILKKNAPIHAFLTEIGCDFKDYAAANQSGNKHVTEIIVPFTLEVLKKKEKGKKSKDSKKDTILKTLSNISQNQMKIERDKLMLLPGNSQWLYYKLYGCGKRQNELIPILYELLEKLVQEGAAQKYFYIRYADPEPHLRIRIQPSEGKLPALYVAASNMLNGLYSDGLISKAVNDSYIRETERYGGPSLITHAEEYFYNDSKLAMKLLNMERFGKLRFNMDFIGISFIVSVLEAFGLTMEEQDAFLSTMSDKKSYRKEFQIGRLMIMNAADSSDDWFSIRYQASNPEIYDFIKENASRLKIYADAVFEADSKGELTNSIKDIAASLIHMFCNRFRDNTWERKIYALAMHGVNGLIGYKKHNKHKSFIPELPESLF